MSGTESLGNDPRWGAAMRHLASVVISGAPPIAQAGRCTISGTRQNVNCTIEYAPNIGFLDVGEQLRSAARQLADIWFEHNSIFPGLTFTLTKQPDGDWSIEIDVAAAPAPASATSADSWDQDSEFDLGDLEPPAAPGGYGQPTPPAHAAAPPPAPGYPGGAPPSRGGPPPMPGAYQDRGAPPMPNSGGHQQHEASGGYQQSAAPGSYQQGSSGGYPQAGPPAGFGGSGAPQQSGGFQPHDASGGFENASGIQRHDEFQPLGQSGFQNSGYSDESVQNAGYQNNYDGSLGDGDAASGGEGQFDDQNTGESSESEDGKSPRRPRRGAARGGMVSEGAQPNPKTIKTVLIGIAAVILLAGLGTGVYFLLSQKQTVRPPKTFEETRKDFETNLSKRAEAPQEFDNTAPDQVKVVYYESGNKKLMAWLVLPDREPPFPAVVFAHDGFALSRADYTNAVPFVSHGFAVLIPSWRGENGNPGDFEMCYGEVDDLVAAIDYMATRKKIDKGSIFAAGHGVGATTVMLAAELSPHLRKAAGCGGRPDMFEAGEAYEHAPFDQRDAEERLMRSPQQFVDDLKCPMLLLYGGKDAGHKFFLEQANKMSKDSKKFPVLVEELPGVNHQTSLAPAIQRMITFFHAR
ncbi:acetylxylan esterase [Candidatus Obscuribacterales bacterium]|nr:acetylxylan esterase [Candidatus Obscuribacterales bacterium]